MQIVSGDEIFARMVLRVLEDAGYRQVSVGSQRSGYFDYAVVDLDFIPSPRLGEHCITVSRDKGKGADLTRPFLTDSLRLLAGRVFGNPESPARSGSTLPDARQTPLSVGAAEATPFSESDEEGLPPSESGSELPRLSENGVTVSDREIPLSPKERALYALLLSRRGEVVGKEEIAAVIFGETEGNSPEVYISYLRKKLDYELGRHLIRTVRGKGYRIP
ncbi:MAG: winged helix-turn-helix domain-containing protein [Eubacteriales bacterium]